MQQGENLVCGNRKKITRAKTRLFFEEAAFLRR